MKWTLLLGAVLWALLTLPVEAATSSQSVTFSIRIQERGRLRVPPATTSANIPEASVSPPTASQPQVSSQQIVTPDGREILAQTLTSP